MEYSANSEEMFRVFFVLFCSCKHLHVYMLNTVESRYLDLAYLE